MQIFSDPIAVLARKLGMIADTVLAAPLDWPAPAAPSGVAKAQAKGRPRAVTHPPDTAMTDATRWMLAVRDRRDRTAFARLYDHFAPRLKGMAMRGGLNAALAEDVVQDVMLTVWHKAAQFDPGVAPVSAWVYRIARNRQIDMARKRARPLPEELIEEASEPDTQQIYAMEQEVGFLQGALAKLAPEQRQMIEKAYMGELSHSEIQAETGLALGTIKSRIRLGLERLRHELKELR